MMPKADILRSYTRKVDRDMSKTIIMRFPHDLAKALTLSYDDAVEQDVRLIDIMKQHGLKGTFNINSSQYIAEDFVYPPEKKWGQRMPRAKATALYGQDGIEPALHALSHPRLETLPAAQVAYEIIKDRENLEEQFGHIVRGMAYPYGTYSDEVVRVLRDCGIVYCRTTKATRQFDLPTEWLTLHPTCHHADPTLPELTRKFVEQTLPDDRQPWMFYLWGHAYEFNSADNWEVIESFAQQIGGKQDIWYATNIEIYEYVESFHRLVYSLDMKLIHNPTATPLWFIIDHKHYHIAPGETLKLDV